MARGHSLRLRSASNSELTYAIEVDNWIKPGKGIGGRDRLKNDRVATGRLVSGVDEWRYSSQRERILASDPDDLELSINGGAWTPGSKFGEVGALGGSSGSGGSPPRGGGGGGGSGQDVLRTSSDYGVLENERTSLGGVGRPYSTDGDIELHVGRGREYESLQAAFNQIPHHVNHEVRIYVHGRTRDRNSAHIHNVQMANDVDFIVDGSDGGVINDGGVNVNIAGKMDHIQFDHLKFEHISQCINARFEDCDFNGNGTAAFSGKEGSKMVIDSVVGSGNDEYAALSVGGEIIEFRNCTLRGERAAIRGNSASTHVLNNCDIKAPKKMAGGSDDVFVGGERVDN